MVHLPKRYLWSRCYGRCTVSLIAAKTDYDSVSVDALCEVMVLVIHNQVVVEAKKVSYRMVHFADCFIRAGEVRS